MALMVKLPINAALATQQHKSMPIPWSCGRSIGRNVSINVSKRRNFMVATASTPAQSVEFANTNTSQNVGLPIMVISNFVDFPKFLILFVFFPFR